ncbi:MAG: DUF4135 domain-containing protein [Clostridia bacterium]|nr:DUF4135 domain-containing protein [Clostridia bacterium]
MFTIDDLLKLLHEEHCVDFLHVEARQSLEEILARSENLPYALSPSAQETIKKQYVDRMVLPYAHTLAVKIMEAVRAYDYAEGLSLRGDHPEVLHKAAADVSRALGPEAGERLRTECPLLCECTAPMRQNFIDSQVEMLRKIGAFQSRIEETLFGGRHFTRLLDFSGDSGDMHRHGRAVRKVVTDAGTFFYKPHDCRSDQLFAELVEGWFSDCTVAIKVVCGPDCGFAEEMKPAPLPKGSTPADYFRNFGMLTALFHGIGARDMHQENIMACGVYPAAVDLETIFWPSEIAKRETGEQRWEYATETERAAKNSVLGTAVFPNWVHKTGMHSALHMTGDGIYCLPVMDGTAYPVTGNERAFVEGFRVGYKRLLEHRDEILRMVERYHAIPIRYVKHNTSYYYVVRRYLLMNDCMKDRERRRQVLDMLKAPYTQKGHTAPESIIRYEQSCLQQGDIPYYCVRADGYALCGEFLTDPVEEDYFSKSPLDHFRERLNSLNPEELSFEEQWILALLRHVPLAVEARPAIHPGDFEPLSEKSCSAIAEEILGAILKDRVTGPDGTPVWHSITQMIEAKENCGTISHSAYAALYCSALWKLDSFAPLRPELQEVIKGFLDHMRDTLANWRRESPRLLKNKRMLDGLRGLGVLCGTLNALARCGFSEAGELLNRLLGLMDSGAIYQNDEKNRCEAGILLALTMLDPEQIPERDTWKRCIRGFAETALEKAPSGRIDDNAVYALAMERTYAITGEAKYLNAAKAGWKRMRDAFIPKYGWHDTYSDDNWMSPMGKNTAWIGSLAMLAGSDGAPVARLALDALKETRDLLPVDSLTEGNAMTALFLLRASDVLGEPELCTAAGRILAAMASCRRAEGVFHVTPAGIKSCFDVDLLCGTLGIGCVMVGYLKMMAGVSLPETTARKTERFPDHA